MKDATDQELIQRFARSGEDDAFGVLVRRHVDFVFSAARRLLVDQHLSEDVTQQVFLALASQAGAVRKRLEAGTPLSGWLHVTTRNLAAKTIRGRERRAAREQEAMSMHEIATGGDEPAWRQIAPHIDEALAELAEQDRDALLLRYFERIPAREIGLRFGIGEEAAQKRVARALDRLRGIFLARGLAVPSSTLAGAIVANAVQPAPAALVSAIAAHGLAVSAGAGAGLALLQLMSMTKMQVSVAALVIGGLIGTVAVQRHENRRLRAEVVKLGTETPVVEAAPSAPPPADTSTDEVVRLRGEVAKLLRERTEMIAMVGREMQARAAAKPRLTANEEAEREAMKQRSIAKMNYTGRWGIAFFLYMEQHNGQMPATFEEATPYLPDGPNEHGFAPDQFEIVYQGRLADLANPSSAFVLREREPFATTAGSGVSRTYLFADGHSEIVRRDDGDFTDWEQRHMPVLRNPNTPAPGSGQ